MNEKKIGIKNSKDLKSSSIPVKNDVLNSKEEFVIPFEAACSPEFVQGCILREDEEDKVDKESDMK